jgi:hypothetical protein
MNRQVLAAAALAAAVVWAVPVTAQEAPAAGDGMLGVGYVANGPHMFLGGTVWGLIPGLNGWGLYVDAKMGITDPANYEGFEPGIENSEVDPQHLPVDNDAYWRAFNVAVTRALTDELVVYAGGGWAVKTQYREWWEQSEVLGRLGYYWVEDVSGSTEGVNLMAGGFLRLSSSVRLQFGGELLPLGFTIGASFVIPGR